MDRDKMKSGCLVGCTQYMNPNLDRFRAVFINYAFMGIREWVITPEIDIIFFNLWAEIVSQHNTPNSIRMFRAYRESNPELFYLKSYYIRHNCAIKAADTYQCRSSIPINSSNAFCGDDWSQIVELQSDICARMANPSECSVNQVLSPANCNHGHFMYIYHQPNVSKYMSCTSNRGWGCLTTIPYQ